ncbi:MULTISPECIES: GNAT family N-acetyltransferase [unclassified Streptomyces]|uniref:GNAT family N-acetyltransferase n=1 Tax=unclassified Streptomyces TaxID=2593676 RepID=UPI00037EDAEE|nr:MULTISPECIES: GNAT family N-acetyltransferase [unclassified Streptomyces]MYT29876.1 GNAT family N-acetyltransferase [Streptomyces sp. SID8354]
MLPDLVRMWAAGWVVSRRRPRAVEHPWGLYIDVGLPDQVGRHVLPDPDESAVHAAAASVTVPYTWLKAPVETETVEPWLPAGWVADKEEAGHLMAADLRATHPVPPEGYRAIVETTDGVTHVEVQDAHGGLAAKGQMAVIGPATVVDRVQTEEAHQRRGLGGFVMRTLADRAVAEGATLGILGATDAGRALYESLGWQRHAGLAACVYRP